MRKIMALAGFIMLLFSLWLYSFTMLFSGFNGFLYSFIFCITGIITMIVAIATHPKEMKEPFKSMAEKFEEMNKPLLIASILIFFSSLWLFSYGFGGTMYYHVMEALTLAPIDNSTLNNTYSMLIHNYDTAILVLSYIQIFTGAAYVATGVNILQKKGLSFIIPSMIFGIVISFLFEFYVNLAMNAWEGMNVGVSVANNHIVWCFRIPLILSAIALFIVIWQYKEYTWKENTAV